MQAVTDRDRWLALGLLLLGIVLVLNAAIALVARWRGAHAEGVVLAGATG